MNLELRKSKLAALSAVTTFLLAATNPAARAADAVAATTPFTASATTPASKSDLSAAQQFSPQEDKALRGVVDETSEFAGDALSVLLRHAMMLPAGTDALAEAERPNPLKLWQEPQRYRGRLVYVVAQFVGKTLDISSQLTRGADWDGPAFATYINVADSPEPIIVILPQRPPDWGRAAKVEVAGFFYKLLDQTSSHDPSKVGAYPVIVARELQRPPVELTGFNSPVALVLGIGAALAVVFFLLRKSTRRRGLGTLETLRQHRAEGAGGQKDSSGQTPDEQELARQVEQYQKEHEGH